MNTGSASENGNAVSCQIRIPMIWSDKSDAPLPGESLHLHNRERLQAIEALETAAKPGTDPPSTTEEELQRLESKLNLALDLLATLLNQSLPRPEPGYIELSAESASWICNEKPEVGSRGRISLYLHPLLAQPVVLPAEIIRCEETGEPGGCMVTCHFDPMPDDLSDALLGYVFRGHRRAVAEQRLQTNSDITYSDPTLK